VAFLPARSVAGVGAIFGELAYRLRIRRGVVLGNIKRAFPDLDADDREKIARETYLNAGRMLAECLRLPSLRPEQIAAMVEETEGWENAERVVAGGKPLIVVTGHIGNWELMGAYFAHLGYRLKVFAKPLHNPLVESALFSMRRASGLDIIYTGTGLKPALDHLRAGGILVFLADQDARKDGIAIPFFGVPASTAPGPAVFARLARVPILPVFAIRVGPARHRVQVFPPIEPAAGKGRDEAIERMTRAHVEALEKIVRQYPGQYFWFHKRWKTPVEKLRSFKKRPNPGE